MQLLSLFSASETIGGAPSAIQLFCWIFTTVLAVILSWRVSKIALKEKKNGAPHFLCWMAIINTALLFIGIAGIIVYCSVYRLDVSFKLGKAFGNSIFTAAGISFIFSLFGVIASLIDIVKGLMEKCFNVKKPFCKSGIAALMTIFLLGPFVFCSVSIGGQLMRADTPLETVAKYCENAVNIWELGDTLWAKK